MTTASSPSLSNESGSYGSNYRVEIDGLRALAVIAVIINHFDKRLLPSGYLGVDIFFVVSGYVITASLAKRSGQSVGELLLGFYARRIKRLLPALALCVAVTGFVICGVDPRPGKSLMTGLFAMSGVSNFYLYYLASDYFSVPAELNVFTETWSLGVEEQFYLIFPALLWLTGFAPRTHGGAKRLAWVLSGLAITSLAAFLYLHDSDLAAAYYLMPPRFWELSAGCLLFLALDGEEGRIASLAKRLNPSIALILLLATLFAPLTFSALATPAVVLWTVCLIASIRPQTTACALLSHPRVVGIGLISYSLYLWAWSVLSLGRWTVGLHWWSVPIMVLLMVLFAAGSYRFVEHPLRHATWSSTPWRTVGRGVVLALGTIGLLVVLGSPLKGALFTGVRQPSRHDDAQWTIEGTTVNVDNCMVEGETPFDAARVARCRVNGDPSAGTVYFVGSSHAMHLVGLGERIHEELQMSVVFTTVQSHNFFPHHVSGSVTLNNPMQASVYAHLTEQLKPGDVVVVGNRLIQQLRSKNLYLDAVGLLPMFPADSLASPGGDEHAITHKQGITEVARLFGERGVPIVYMLPLPEYPFHSFGRCSKQWFNAGLRSSGACMPKTPAQRQRQIDDRRALLTGIPNLHLFDAAKVLCPDSLAACPPAYDGVALFVDSDHLSNAGAASLFDEFKALMQHRGRPSAPLREP